MTTKKIIYLFIGAMFLVLTGFLIQGPTQSAAAEVQVEMVQPPPIEIPENPELIMVPKTKVYYIPKIESRVVYYDGTWYRLYEKSWYTSTSYSGPWVNIKTAPKTIIELPAELPEGTIIRYKELK